MAILTIIINGLTCGKVVNALGMIHEPHIKRKLMSKSVRDILYNAHSELNYLKQEPSLAFSDWEKVK